MRSVNHDSNLSVLSATKRNIFDASTKLDHTIHVRAAVFVIANADSTRVNALRRLDSKEGSTTIFRISLNGLDLTGVSDDVLVLGSRRSKHLDERLLVGSQLIDLNGHHRISLCFEHCDSCSELLLAEPHVNLVAKTHVDHALLRDLVLEEVRGRLENILLRLIGRLEQVSHRRLGNAHTLTNGDVGPTLLFESESL